MLGSYLLSLLVTIGIVYAALLAAYFATCLAITLLVRRTKVAKIQDRSSAPEQIRRDRRQSIISIGSIATLFGVGQWTYATLGWGFQVTDLSLPKIVLSFLASMLLFDTWFYWLHRLVHTRPLYRKVHLWHHQTVTPEVWSNNSELVVDNLFLQSYWLVAHFLIPIAPLVLFAHRLYDQVMGVIGHSGYEFGGKACWPPSPMISVTHHDQHHQYVRCNFGGHFTFWDRLMGTLHPHHDSKVKQNIVGIDDPVPKSKRI
jgi:Delta7-sterol 5-desaturase